MHCSRLTILIKVDVVRLYTAPAGKVNREWLGQAKRLRKMPVLSKVEER